MKLIPMAAAVLAAALTLANAASAAPGPLQAPPADSSPTASTIFDAMLSIARAAGSNPAAAQQATFSYDAAIQQYNARDFERARMSALTAISQTSVPPLPAPSIFAPAIPQPSFYSMPLVVGANAADAEGYVALARRSTTQCGAPNAAPAAAVQQQYNAAIAALVARNYAAAKTASLYVVNQCSAATTAYTAQQAALPQPSATPIPMSPYSPLPLATLGPDPALQGTTSH